MLFQLHGESIKNPVTSSNSYTPQARILMQEKAVHIAVSDCGPQCLSFNAPGGGQTDA